MHFATTLLALALMLPASECDGLEAPPSPPPSAPSAAAYSAPPGAFVPPNFATAQQGFVPTQPANPPPFAHVPQVVPPGATLGVRHLPFTDPERLTEVNRTLDMMERGGPFVFRQDGVVFMNRERQLPPRPNGYYHEFTVQTPGLSHRGARRIVRGDGGDHWYTDDHYRSFVTIDPRRY